MRLAVRLFLSPEINGKRMKKTTENNEKSFNKKNGKMLLQRSETRPSSFTSIDNVA